MLGRVSNCEVKKRVLGIPLRWYCLFGPLLSPKWSVTALFVYPVRRGQAPTLNSYKSITCTFYFIIQTMYIYHIYTPLAACMLSHVQLFANPWTVAHPLFMELSRQECWSGLPFPPPGNLPDPGIKPMSPVSPALAGRFLSLSYLGSPYLSLSFFKASVTTGCIIYSLLICQDSDCSIRK